MSHAFESKPWCSHYSSTQVHSQPLDIFLYFSDFHQSCTGVRRSVQKHKSKWTCTIFFKWNGKQGPAPKEATVNKMHTCGRCASATISHQTVSSRRALNKMRFSFCKEESLSKTSVHTVSWTSGTSKHGWADRQPAIMCVFFSLSTHNLLITVAFFLKEM